MGEVTIDERLVEISQRCACHRGGLEAAVSAFKEQTAQFGRSQRARLTCCAGEVTSLQAVDVRKAGRHLHNDGRAFVRFYNLRRRHDHGWVGEQRRLDRHVA